VGSLTGHVAAYLAEALRYLPEGRGSNHDEVIGFSNLPSPSSRTMALGSNQPLTEMSTRNLPGGKEQQARKAENLTFICEPTV
jgi:hypothetical protein